MVAHPAEISDITVSYDGRFIFSSGGSDLALNMWKVDVNEALAKRDDISDYVGLLEGGLDGHEHNEIIDFFYYCQIRAQGEDALEMRDISGLIHICFNVRFTND